MPPTAHKGDVAWMIIATILVIAMSLPGLALFYGGLVRSKNMLSILIQVFTVFYLAFLLWTLYGYSIAFTEATSLWGSLDKSFLIGVSEKTFVDTLTQGVHIPEYLFFAFQGSFAAITLALTVGAYAERMKFSAVILFSIIWFTIGYLPVAHMVWHSSGLLFKSGALDFAGGTVVHINAGIAGLIGAYIVGPRLGYGKEAMPPHSLTLTMVGASMLWVGWFGFNAGSGLEANGLAALALVNTILAPAAAAIAWSMGEMLHSKKSHAWGTLRRHQRPRWHHTCRRFCGSDWCHLHRHDHWNRVFMGIQSSQTTIAC